MTDAFLYIASIFRLCIFIYVLLLLYKIAPTSLSQGLFYLAVSMEL